MLSRVCVLFKKEIKEDTAIFLAIFEGSTQSDNRRRWLEANGHKEAAWGPLFWDEKLTLVGDDVWCRVNVVRQPHMPPIFCGDVLFGDVYKVTFLSFGDDVGDDVF